VSGLFLAYFVQKLSESVKVVASRVLPDFYELQYTRLIATFHGNLRKLLPEFKPFGFYCRKSHWRWRWW